MNMHTFWYKHPLVRSRRTDVDCYHSDLFMALLATITPSSSQNSNLSLNSPPSWLVEIHSELWGRRDRVLPLMLFRNEWGTMIDLFNEREKGIRGSAVFTGQPGIGEHHYWYLTVTSNQRTRENMSVIFHPFPLHHSRPVNCVPGYVWQGLHY